MSEVEVAKRRIFSCVHCGHTYETKSADPHYLPSGWARVKYGRKGYVLLACSLEHAMAEVQKRKLKVTP